jgi:hypothetical protein
MYDNATYEPTLSTIPCSLRFVKSRGGGSDTATSPYDRVLNRPAVCTARVSRKTTSYFASLRPQPSDVLSDGADGIACLTRLQLTAQQLLLRQVHRKSVRRRRSNEKYSKPQPERGDHSASVPNAEPVSSVPQSHEPALPAAIGRDRHLHVSLAESALRANQRQWTPGPPV